MTSLNPDGISPCSLCVMDTNVLIYYGQQETVQVYNVLAEDTFEERIYGLLDKDWLSIGNGT